MNRKKLLYIVVVIVVIILASYTILTKKEVNLSHQAIENEILEPNSSNKNKLALTDKMVAGLIIKAEPKITNKAIPDLTSNTEHLSLQVKNKKEIDYLEKMEKEANDSTNKVLANDESSKRLNVLVKLNRDAAAKNWNEFKQSIVLLHGEDVEFLSIALMQAIDNKAPFEIIEELLNQGATINPAAILTLSITNNVFLTKKLLNYGLDLHFVDPIGRNALSYVLKIGKAREMFDFLLEHGVSINPLKNALDPLDIALQTLTRRRTGIYYVNQLLTRGAIIEPSHQELLTKLKNQYPNLYSQINI